MNEAFLSIPGYPDYALDTQGNVWSLGFRNGNCPEGIPRLKRMAPGIRTSRNKTRHYPMVPLSHNGKAKNVPIHRIVCLVHNGPPPTEKHMALHKDDDYSNLKPSNLYWGTAEQNAADSLANDTFACGERQHNSKLTEEMVREIRRKAALGMSYSAIAKEYGVHKATPARVVRKESWKHVA